MQRPLFEFELRDLDLVEPWGAPADPNLHWFGLTDGTYRINAGDATLFEYSAAAQAQGFPKYCDYQVVRLYEDVLQSVPSVLEVIPADLRRFLMPDENGSWGEYWRAWCGIPEEKLHMLDGSDLLGDAAELFGARVLDSLYLSPSVDAHMWSDEEHVYLQWDNRDKLAGGQPAWSADKGQFTLSREDFLEEVHSFHTRLMAQMEARVDEVQRGHLAPGIRVDIGALVGEHRVRSASIECQLTSRTETDWALVTQSVRRLEDLRAKT